MTKATPRFGACGIALVLLAGCSAPVATALEEHDANEVVALFGAHGIAAEKEPDPEHENAYRINVGRGDAPAALGLLADAELPRPKTRGLGDMFDGKALVPTSLHERAQLTAGIAGDLERTLLGVDGVRVARVHLSMPEPQLRERDLKGRATASVLIEHRGATPPMTVEAVQRLVAGAAQGLSPEDVSVVNIARPKVPDASAREMASVGPISVSRGSVHVLQLALGGAFALVVVFAGLFVATYARLANARRFGVSPGAAAGAGAGGSESRGS